MRADARLRPLGIRRGVRGARRRPSTGWEALTAAEVKIAELVGAGQSNPDIAAALYLSRSTVQTHVSHILAKLGAHSRMEIARQLLRRHNPEGWNAKTRIAHGQRLLIADPNLPQTAAETSRRGRVPSRSAT